MMCYGVVEMVKLAFVYKGNRCLSWLCLWVQLLGCGRNFESKDSSLEFGGKLGAAQNRTRLDK